MGKFIRGFVIFAGVAAGRAAGPADVAAQREAVNHLLTPQQADRDFAAFAEFERTPPPSTPDRMGPANYLRWYQQMLLRINLAGLTLYQSYPEDPRRWEVVAMLLNNPPMFAQEIPDDVATKGAGAIVIDERAKAGWTAKAAQLRHALLAAPDAAASVKEAVEWGAFVREFKLAADGVQQGRPVNWAAFAAQLDKHVAKYAALNVGVPRALDYLSALKKIAPEEAAAGWVRLQQSPDAALQARAKTEVQVAAARREPFVLQFKALDGQAVDVARWRGRVVIVDYWAPEFATAITDLPNLQALYRLYHPKGLEIVGIVVAAGEDRDLVTDFIRDRKVAWPQGFDALGRSAPAIVTYGVEKGPHRFVLDRTGRIVATDPSLPELNALVKQLLGIPG